MKSNFTAFIVLAALSSLAAAATPNADASVTSAAAQPPTLVEQVEQAIEAVEDAFTPNYRDSSLERDAAAIDFARRHRCYWSGTAPLCLGYCGAGYVEVKRDASGDGMRCWAGTKALCCRALKAPPPGHGHGHGPTRRRNGITFPPVVQHTMLPPPKMPISGQRRRPIIEDAEVLGPDDEAVVEDVLDEDEDERDVPVKRQVVEAANVVLGSDSEEKMNKPEEGLDKDDSEQHDGPLDDEAEVDADPELDADPEHLKDVDIPEGDEPFDPENDFDYDAEYDYPEEDEEMPVEEEKPRRWFTVRSEREL
ncbi:hypothetical protein BDN70DRAFT_927809 [Pholiota conissans]|uniref:Uncharacterized protein n=1 Tax=Pholiota conissans TaxID=109636 RepID=A0A9P5ZC75_9AGAR|nr:hypothetical protein BDN70DRAFT_927809 [Pholiota conissans]